MSAAENTQTIAEIMDTQRRLQLRFGFDRNGPLFSSHLTMTQLKILMLLKQEGTVTGGELARMLGVGLAALSGMVDRLVVQDLVNRAEDLHDRRVRRIGLTATGNSLIESIFSAGETKMRTLLSRLTAEQLDLVGQASALLLRAAEENV